LICLTEGTDLSTSWPTEMFTVQQHTNTIMQQVKKITHIFIQCGKNLWTV
jgi:hypothetical protein